MKFHPCDQPSITMVNTEIKTAAFPHSHYLELLSPNRDINSIKEEESNGGLELLIWGLLVC